MKKTVQSKKFKGVRQRHWGSWVSEIRHPLLKRRVWLGTFETAEAAAQAYDEAAVLMNGRNAKTNFPAKIQTSDGQNSILMSPAAKANKGLSEILLAKLSKTPSSQSVTCLRLNTESCSIGVWQKRGGQRSDSTSWVLTAELGKLNNNIGSTINLGQCSSSSSSSSSSELNPAAPEEPRSAEIGRDQEDRIAHEMIEELLNMNWP